MRKGQRSAQIKRHIPNQCKYIGGTGQKTPRLMVCLRCIRCMLWGDWVSNCSPLFTTNLLRFFKPRGTHADFPSRLVQAAEGDEGLQPQEWGQQAPLVAIADGHGDRLAVLLA